MIWLSLAFTISTWIADTDARAAIERVITVVVDEQDSDTVWTETTKPKVTIDTIRFTAPDAAIASVTVAQYGSLIIAKKTPIEFVLRNGAKGWQVVSQRALRSYISSRLVQ